MGAGQVELVRRFYDAFNGQDIDAFAATLHPEIELQTARGLRRGIDEAREWATTLPTGELDQRLVVEELREVGEHVIALVRRQWWWREDGELAAEEEVVAIVSFLDGLIRRWQPYAERDEAIAVLEAGVRASGSSSG
jgi:ketosteroid isomerase-like protein